jgi:WD40 repeat protein
MMATRENDHPLALLWFARAVQLARDEPQQEELNRIRVANWLRQVCLPEGTFTVPGFRQGHDHVRTLRFSPDGRYVLVVGGPGGCRVWDRLGGRPVRLPEPAARGPAAAWQPESGLLAVAYGDGRIRFLAPPEFQPTGEAISAGEVTVLAFSRDGRSLAWGGPGGARVWDVGKKEYLTPLLAHPAPVATVSFSAAGDRLATSARDLKARVFRVDREDREPLFPPVSHWLGEYSDLTPDEPGRAAPQFVAGDQVLLTVEKTAQGPFALIRRSALTGQRLSSSGAPAGVEYLVACAASPQGDQAAVLWGDAARLLDTSTGKMLLALPRGRARFENATFSADGKTLVTCGSDGGLRFWPVDDLPEDFRLPTFTSPVWNPLPTARVELTSDGRHVAVAHWDGRVCLWQLPEGPPASYSLPSGWGTLTALSPDGRLVLPRGMSFRNGALLSTQAYHADSGRAAGPRLDPGGVLLDAAFSPDGARVATASSTGRNPTERNQRVFRPEGKGGNVQLWDWKTGKRLVGPIPTPGEPRGLAFHPDGHTLAVVCADYRVLVVDPGTGTVVNNLDPGVRTRRWGNANQWWSNGEARFSPDGRFLVTWEMSSHVHVWDPERGQLLHTLSHGERVGHVCFHPTVPTLLATGSWDRSARVWDLTTGKLLVQIKHPQWVTRVRFSPDGRDLITSCGDGMLRVWDWDSGKLKDGLLLQSYLLQDFGFTRDRRWLISLGAGEFQVTDWQTRTPVGPLWNLKPRFNLELAIPGDGRRAIVGAFADSLVGYDLEKMVTPVSGPAEDLVQLAELAAGRRILSAGRVVPLTSAEWADRWQRVRRDFPTGWPSTTTALPPSP